MEEKCFLWDDCNHCDCGRFCLRKYKLESLYANACIPQNLRKRIPLFPDTDGTDLEAFKQLSALEKNITDFVRSGKHLYLHSNNCGNGKTSWAIRLAQAYLNDNWPDFAADECPVLLIDVDEYLRELKENITHKLDSIEHIMDNILKADLVIWDDIASKCGTEFEINNLLGIIDRRISLGKANIYTTNLNNQAMYNALGERLASRICNLSIDISLAGADKRQFAR